MEDTRTHTIVVGVDGTPASKAALKFAIGEAAARGSAVEVVTAWRWYGPREALAGPATPREALESAQSIQDEAVAQVLRAVPGSPIVSRQVVQGDPAEVLLRAGRGADYLVLGTEHKGILKRAVLGSVSETCVRRATCPVVVVRATDEPAPHAPLVSGAGA